MVQRKGGKDKDGDGSSAADVEARVVLQAVVLADSFAQHFRPITMDKPKVLLPLAGIPMIDYTLEWLASAGVEECFVLCCAHSQQVTAHLKAVGWMQQPHLRVHTVVARDCTSVGDALRHIDQKGVIRSDFVLVTGDVVANVPLTRVLEEHRERRRHDKQAVLTMLMRRCAPPHPITKLTRTGQGPQVVGISPASKQLLLYDPPKTPGSRREGEGDDDDEDTSGSLAVVGGSGVAAASGGLCVEAALVREHGCLEIHRDWEDCHIDICAPEVLYLYTDNFDYQHPRHDFVRGILSDDIMGNKVYVHEIDSSFYAARVETLRSYSAITADVIRRWTFPLVPESTFGSNSIRSSPSSKHLEAGRGNRYKGKGVVLGRTAVLSENSLIADGTTVGNRSVIRHSVVGSGCVIGRDVRVEGSCVWDGVQIGDGVIVRNAVVCDGAVIHSGAVVECGAVIGFKVVVGPEVYVPPFARLSLHEQPDEEEEDSDEEGLEYSSATTSARLQGTDNAAARGEERGGEEDGECEVGKGSSGHQWRSSLSMLEQWRISCAPLTADVAEAMCRAELARVGRREAAEGAAEGRGGKSGDEGRGAAADASDKDDDEEDEDGDDFEEEVEELFKRAVEEGVSHDNVVLEVNALKLAFNKSFADCAGSMFKGMLNLSVRQASSKQPQPLLAKCKAVISKWSPLLRRFLKSTDDEVEVLLTLEEICMDVHKSIAPIFVNVLEALYDADAVSEEAVYAWAEEKQGADEADKIFLKASAKFLQWLREAEEEDDDDDDDDDDE